MTSVVAFGNCQADALAQVLRIGLDEAEHSIEWISNNPLTGGMEEPESVLARITAADIVIYQPLRAQHGPLAEGSVRSAARGVTVTFAYLFNSGMAGLCHAPFGKDDFGRKRGYGRIFGDDAIIELLNAGAAEEDVAAAYERGEIDFRLPERFATCMTELRSREARTDVRVADSIVADFRETQQFLAHNHPTAALLTEVCAQVEELTGLPIDLDAIRRSGNEPLRGQQRAPISPHDARALGYRFPPTENWAALGRALIHLICEERGYVPAVTG